MITLIDLQPRFNVSCGMDLNEIRLVIRSILYFRPCQRPLKVSNAANNCLHTPCRSKFTTASRGFRFSAAARLSCRIIRSTAGGRPIVEVLQSLHQSRPHLLFSAGLSSAGSWSVFHNCLLATQPGLCVRYNLRKHMLTTLTNNVNDTRSPTLGRHFYPPAADSYI